MIGWLWYVLKNRTFLWMMFCINLAGTAYGYYWYYYQLKETPWYFIPFVPDSPTASLFFLVVLIGFMMNRNSGLFQALAAVSLLKYGVWAVGMNLAGSFVGDPLTFENYMLIFSHLGMAIEGLLYARFYQIKTWHWIVTAIWVIHNEMIDYVFGMMPRYYDLMKYEQIIGYITFWLSILSIFAVYFAVNKRHLGKQSV